MMWFALVALMCFALSAVFLWQHFICTPWAYGSQVWSFLLKLAFWLFVVACGLVAFAILPFLLSLVYAPILH